MRVVLIRKRVNPLTLRIIAMIGMIAWLSFVIGVIWFVLWLPSELVSVVTHL